MNGTPPSDDQAGPEEPDAGHDLRSDTRRVEHDCADRQDVTEAVLADEDDQCGRRPDDGLGAQARAFALNLTLEPDQGGEQEGDDQFDELAAALPSSMKERRVCREPHLHGAYFARPATKSR